MSYAKQIVVSEADVVNADPTNAARMGLTPADIPVLEALWHEVLKDLGTSLRIEQMLEFLENIIAFLKEAVTPADIERMHGLVQPVSDLP